MDLGGRKRGSNHNAAAAGNGATKRTRQVTEWEPVVGSNSKPCSKFFSTSGCQFGEGCHYVHYVPGGYNAASQFTNMGGRKPPMQQLFTDGPAPSLKTKLCNRIKSPEGCKFGDMCRFAHSEAEIGGRPSFPSYENPRGLMNYGGYNQQRFEPSSPAAANFGQSATAKISIDASLAGPVIGKGGVNSKQICQITGVKLYVRDHETDESKRILSLKEVLIK